MTLSDEAQRRVQLLAQGKVKPETGMEKHFLLVLKGKNRPATQEERRWLTYWESSGDREMRSIQHSAFDAVKEVITQAAMQEVNMQSRLCTAASPGNIRKPG